MKNIKTLFASVVVATAVWPALASYVFSWALTGDAAIDYDYAVIAVYSGNTREGYLYAARDAEVYESPNYFSTVYDSASKFTKGQTGYVMADVDAFYRLGDMDAYTYSVELIKSAGVLKSQAYSYAGLFTANTVSDLNTVDPTTAAVRTVNIPEPTSALLLIAGFGLLGLKRKLRKGIAALVAVCAFSGMLMAAENDAVITFGTAGGNDKYADGTTVLDGERYALVYAADVAQVKFFADGKVEGADLAVIVSKGKNGSCKTTAFQIDASLGCTDLGKFHLFLLDTRLADGKTLASGGNSPAVINGYAPVEGASVQVSAISELPSDTPNVEFTDIEVGDEWVSLTMKNTVPYVQYTVDDDEASVSNGKADLNDTITITVPRKDGGQTFKARRK